MARLRAYLFADPLIVLATILFGTISLLVSFFDHTGSLQIRVARRWARTLLAICGIRVNVDGLEHIDPHGSYVFVANHASYMDTPVVLANIPVQFRFLAKRGLFQIPFLGNHLHRAGHIPVPREDPRGAVRTMQLAGDIIREKGISLLIFPEGGRSADGRIRPFKEGAAYIAIKAGVPIVPVVLSGTRDCLPMHSTIVRPGVVKVKVLPPIPTSQLTLRDRGTLSDRLRGLIVCELSPDAVHVG